MNDRPLWGPAVGWAVIAIGIHLTASVLLGRLPKRIKEQLRPGAPLVLIRIWLGGLGLGSVVFGVGLVRQDGVFAFLAGLAVLMWATVMRLLIWLKRLEDGD